MQLTHIHLITGLLTLKTGLRIVNDAAEMHIGGVDDPVLRNPLTNQPYIPGSSLKGRMRSLLEWKSGAVRPNPLGLADLKGADPAQKKAIEDILKLFGFSGGVKPEDEQLASQIGPTRLSFWDCELHADWVAQHDLDNLGLTEIKTENTIDRITGQSENLRHFERILAGAQFSFHLSLKEIDGEDLLPAVWTGLRLIELDSLGGSGSRGYGKVKFTELRYRSQDIELVDDPFKAK
jgi:CRISPR-associated protein Csm3